MVLQVHEIQAVVELLHLCIKNFTQLAHDGYGAFTIDTINNSETGKDYICAIKENSKSSGLKLVHN